MWVGVGDEAEGLKDLENTECEPGYGATQQVVPKDWTIVSRDLTSPNSKLYLSLELFWTQFMFYFYFYLLFSLCVAKMFGK